ncbi:acyltransferase [Allofournierella massiliensis]|uniref:Maltose O-acetyltransferase n=1 Tax=Allofournierella massiliensis TaxID=1650663 RepID=A0A4R1R784_9FIRM|nr:acyltransferase [Fournierella massiliensis]TCL61380.1 maltose O-acetyltransferase [Fournierella massiliensis]
MNIVFKMLYKVIAMKLPESGCSFLGIEFGNYARKFRRFTYQRWTGRFIPESVNIERNVALSDDTLIGERSGIGRDSIINYGVSIGNDVMIGPFLLCYTQNHEFKDVNIPMIEQGFSERKPIHIEDNVWIGARVTILPGVTLGTGCIVGAGAVVTKDVPPYAIVVGNPGRVVKYRE